MDDHSQMLRKFLRLGCKHRDIIPGLSIMCRELCADIAIAVNCYLHVENLLSDFASVSAVCLSGTDTLCLLPQH